MICEQDATIQNLSVTIPSDLRISTYTATCKLNSEILLPIVAEKLQIDKDIIYIEYADNISKGVNIKNISKKAKEKKKVFYNQITIIVRPYNNRYNNVKLFNNGAISMTGLKNFDEGEKSIKILIDKISKLKGFIFNELTDKYILDNSIIIDDKSKIKCSSCNENFNFNVMKHSDCNCYFCNNCIKDKKCIKENNCKKCDKLLLKNAFTNNDCKINNYKIVLINSDYFIGFEIKRDILHKILINNYNIYSSYEPCIYPAVNSKYYWNKNYKNLPLKGKCYCNGICDGKGKGEGEGQCKKITICIFQSGSIIITGARSMEQILDSYNFINEVITDNYDSIKKVNADFLEKEEPKQHQCNRKKTIKIKVSDIQDYPQPEMLKIIVEKYKLKLL